MKKSIFLLVVAVVMILGWSPVWAEEPAGGGGDACSSCDAGCAAGAEPAKTDGAAVVPAKVEEKKVAEFPLLKTEELADMIKAKATLLLFDARSGKYDDGKRIPGAKSLNDTSTAEEIAKLIPAKDAKVITYCVGLTCPASANLAKHLKALGYTNVTEYPEGIEGWTKAGKETETMKQ